MHPTLKLAALTFPALPLLAQSTSNELAMQKKLEDWP